MQEDHQPCKDWFIKSISKLDHKFCYIAKVDNGTWVLLNCLLSSSSQVPASVDALWSPSKINKSQITFTDSWITFASAVIESNSSKSKSYLALEVLGHSEKAELSLQGDVGECSVDGVPVPAGEEGRVAGEEDIGENSHRPHVWNTNIYWIWTLAKAEPDPVEMSS